MRLIDAPISEISFFGMAIGSAIVVACPIVENIFIGFACMVMDQIVNKAVKSPFLSRSQGNVPLVFRAHGGAGNGLDGEHSQSLEIFYYHIPGLKEVKPSTP